MLLLHEDNRLWNQIEFEIQITILPLNGSIFKISVLVFCLVLFAGLLFVCFNDKIKICQVAEHYLLYKYNPEFLQYLIFTNTAGELLISATRKVTIVSAPIP